MNYEDYVLDKTRVVKGWLNESAKAAKVEWLARQMDISGARLYQQLSLTNERDKFHLKNLPILIKETGDFAILNEIEALLGRIAFAMPPPRADLKKVVDEQVTAIREFGELLAEVAQTVADGKVSAAELADVERECFQAMAQIAVLVETVRSMGSSSQRPVVSGQRFGEGKR